MASISPTAKEYLKSRGLSKDELYTLAYFDQYTLEAIMIYVLAMIFNSIHEHPAVRVSTLIDQLDEAVRVQASLFESRKTASPPSSHTNLSNDVQSDANADNKQLAKRKRRTREDYTIAVLLVEFLISREFLSLNKDLSIN